MADIFYREARRRAENAFESVVLAYGGDAVSGVTIYKGLSNADLASPRLEIMAGAARPEYETGDAEIGDPSGNLFLDIDFYIVSPVADLDRDIHAARCSAIEDCLFRTNLDEALDNLGAQEITVHTWTPGVSEEEFVLFDQLIVTPYSGVLWFAPAILED